MARHTSGVTLQQLYYFIEVAAEGSITAAAEILFVAQPTMSAAMKDLETRVGRSLLLRSARGVSLTTDGAEFLGYARQVVEQVALLEQRYLGRPPLRRLLGVSTQHYSFAVDAFVRMVRGTEASEYEFSLRETRTWDIIEDVRTLRSELGILYRNDFNRNVIDKLLRDSGLIFRPLFLAEPHIFISRKNPLAKKRRATLTDLADLQGKRVATSYVALVGDFLARHGVQVEMVGLDGAVESAVKLGVADAVADVVSTGSTLRAQGLEIFGPVILESTAVLISANADIPGIATLQRRLQGVLVARQYVLMDYDVERGNLEAASAVTPGLESPTISPLQDPEWVAVRAMVPRSDTNQVMDQLYEIGARAILVSAIHAARI